jgi:hypothetical protein
MKTQNSKTAATITAETGGENPTALHHDVDDIRERAARGYRRSVFVPGFPEINTAAIRTCFGMHIEFLSAATFMLDERVFGDKGIRSGIEMMLLNPQEKLLITVHVYRPVPEAVQQTYETRVVHCANRLGDDDYETTQVYLASGVMDDAARAIFEGEYAGLQKIAREHLRRGREVSPFCQWQFTR